MSMPTELTKRQREILLILALEQVLGNKTVSIAKVNQSFYVDSPHAANVGLGAFSQKTLRGILDYIDGTRVYRNGNLVRNLVRIERASACVAFVPSVFAAGKGRRSKDGD